MKTEFITFGDISDHSITWAKNISQLIRNKIHVSLFKHSIALKISSKVKPLHRMGEFKSTVNYHYATSTRVPSTTQV